MQLPWRVSIKSCRYKRPVECHHKKECPDDQFYLSVEQMKSAPPEVRRWIEREITTSLTALGKPEHDPSQVHAAALAACMPEEAM